MTEMEFQEPREERAVEIVDDGRGTGRHPILQFGLGLEADTMARLDRLRACLGISRSRITEMALVGGGLNKLERQNAAGVQRFNALAARHGLGWAEFARQYADKYSRKTYPPTIEELEQTAKVLLGGDGGDQNVR